VAYRPGPQDLRASDEDRERVVTMLSEAAADGRLTLGEHAERTERAYTARTLGELAVLTTDLAAPSAQPFRLDGRRLVAGVFSREHRDGRWVVPDRFAVSAIFGEVVLDLRDALLQSQRVQLFATVIGGTLRLIVPEGLEVEVTSAAPFGRRDASSGSGPGSRALADVRRDPRGSQRGATGAGVGATAAAAGQPVIEIRLFSLGGRVKVVRPRRPRRLGLRRRN
jgi:hypothetical protein